MEKLLAERTPSFGAYISRHLPEAGAGVIFKAYGQWSMRHHDDSLRFGTRRDGLVVLCPMIRLYPGRAQTASSEWMFFNPGRRQPVKYTWHRTMESGLSAVFQRDRGEALEKCVFVPYSKVEAVMDLFLWHRGDCYLIQFTNSMTHKPCAERMLEIIRSMNNVSPAALNPDDIGISDDWVIPNLVYAVPGQTVSSFKFQPFQCTTSMLTPDQRTELVATLTAKVKQFKIGVPLTTRAGAPAETKAEYDATTSTVWCRWTTLLRSSTTTRALTWAARFASCFSGCTMLGRNAANNSCSGSTPRKASTLWLRRRLLETVMLR